jgi:acetoin utilization protein AcuC
VPNLFSHNLGTGDNPVFPDVYDWAMLVAGASIQCAEEILKGGSTRALNISGGLHHAMPSRASGFCHVNDVVLAIQALRDAGKRVAYVDIDAHHGDGVQAAFYSAADVLTLSIHQTGFTLFPGTGFVEETGDGKAPGMSVNIPLQPGAGDEAYERSFQRVVLPFLAAFKPDVLVTQLGADALMGDIVANLRMSLRQFERCVTAFRRLDIPWIALGGGGYDVGNVVRAWTLAWAVMLDVDLPDEIPGEWMTAAARYGAGVSHLRGSDAEPPTPDRVLEDLDQTIERLCDTVYPLLGGR